jgi:integrase
VEHLVSDRKADFVLASLTADKYGDRSPAIGKRFGRLKTALGFGPKHVFHSIRHTVATLLENAGVPEGVSADIIEHDKDTMTYGLYSGGASLRSSGTQLRSCGTPSGSLSPRDEQSRPGCWQSLA